MWRFKSSDDSGGDPYLTSLNGFRGRQVWHFDDTAGTPDQCQAVEEARKRFQASRNTQKHSGDELLRLQCVAGYPDAKPASTNGVHSNGVPSNGLHTAQPTDHRLEKSLLSAIGFYQQLQQDDGHWPGDYGGPMFLMPGMIIACHVTGCMQQALSPEHIKEMLRYLRNHQNTDGGYGVHIEGHSTMFGTALRY